MTGFVCIFVFTLIYHHRVVDPRVRVSVYSSKSKVPCIVIGVWVAIFFLDKGKVFFNSMLYLKNAHYHKLLLADDDGSHTLKRNEERNRSKERICKGTCTYIDEHVM